MRRLSQTVQGMSGELDIANLWRENYSSISNNFHYRTEGTVFKALHYVPRVRMDFTSMEEICLPASEHSNGQSQGMDGIPNEFYKVAPGFIYASLRNFINCAFSHSFLPSNLTDAVLEPILKSSLKDPVDANNYRPTAIVSGTFKTIEKILLVSLKNYIFYKL